MIQEKYNNKIWSDGTEESIRTYSHLRANILSPVEIKGSDTVLCLEPDSVSMVEYLEEKAESVTVKSQEDELPSDRFDLVISLGSLKETPGSIKKILNPEGRLVVAIPKEAGTFSVVKKLITEAGFDSIEIYRACPDYLYTSEFFAEDYAGGEAGDYLLIAK
ncbi:MAG: hypothetical protein K5773_01145 [Pseudobutyrivibrio sp.]|nr:hypothetical protein [Pseudobutyrivibrio sp.]